MSSPSPWLTKQRKTELVELAKLVGLTDYSSLLKPQLEVALEDHLKKHQSTLAKNPAFSGFYKTTSSPVKKEIATASALVNADIEAKQSKPRGRRVTKVSDEIGNTDESSPDGTGRSALLARTPRANLAFARNVPLPPSPAVVADAIDRRTAALRRKAIKSWKKSGVTDRAEGLRDTLSSVVSVEALVLLIEAIGLRTEVLPTRYAFTIPGVAPLRTPAWPVYLPDFFLLLTSAFWLPVTLWLTTSFIAPLAFAYFFNLSHKAKASTRSSSAYKFDPLTFNIAKALVTYLVYGQGVKFGGIVGDDSPWRIITSVPGGYEGILIGAGIGALTSVYEAVLKK
ncbi:MAG: hypothetical protein M1814_003030 [Vezdaea aestivalis]|nr:MAG: hypothetical protein M1814_003030 [Vezdaea aestivalis]